MKMAEVLANSNLVPDHYRLIDSKGKENPAAIGNIMIVMDMSLRAGLALQPIMQSSYVIGGNLAFESKLALSLLNVSRRTIGPPKYAWDNSRKAMTVTLTDRETGTEVSHTLSEKTVQQAGWDKNPAWRADTQMMYKYRSLMQLIRVTYPEVLQGLVTVDEMEEMQIVDAKAIDSKTLYDRPSDDVFDDSVEFPEETADIKD